MRFVDEFRNPEVVRTLVRAILDMNPPPMTLMEVCGTHTMSIARCGLRKLLPPQIRLISGPGCPVCVTPQGEIDAFLKLAHRKDITLATFGDMLRVPGSESNLEAERARGTDVQIVYSPLDAVEFAKIHPQQQIVFFGVGFETTAPTVAVALKTAADLKLKNFSVFSAHKLIPPALKALLSSPGCSIDGLICPGHVSAIIGADAYAFAAEDYNVSCVVSGFEPTDILQSVLMLARQRAENLAKVEIQYSRIVTFEGNKTAQFLLNQTFQPCDTNWRGLGCIPQSGMALREEFAEFDASRRFSELTEIPSVPEPVGCMCGEILKGTCEPAGCPLFGRVCTPADPVGPCMVSSEGACAAAYKYGEVDD